MRAASHRKLGIYLAEHYMPNLPRKYLRAYLIGCTQPDKNPTTYLKGSVRNRWLHGHDYTSARQCIGRLIKRLQKSSKWKLADYYTLGKLIHYTADAFTFSHNDDFPGNISAHRRYEQLHQIQFLQRLKQHPAICPSISHSPLETIQIYHSLYRKSPRGIHTDIDFTIGVSSLIMQLLISPVRMEIFSI